MTSAGVFSPPVAKEIRALLPVWISAVTLVVVSRAGLSLETGIGPTFLFIGAGLLGFALGSIALGAMSVGHEYSQRTLTLLLSQPIDRRRLFVYKYAVLVAMVGTLLGITVLLFHPILDGGRSQITSAGFLALAVASGVVLAPWLTITCRSPLAGAVFAVGIPGLLATASDLVAGLVLGFDHPAAVDRLSRFIFWPAIVLTCGAAAAGAWRRFLRLEVIDGSHAELQLPGAALDRAPAGAVARRSTSAARALFAKELRLQQMIFIVAAVFTAVSIAVAVREVVVAGPPEFPFVPVAVFYAMMLALLAGSLTSAQERELGTLEWQSLQPVAAWQQWLAKVGVAGLLVLTFGVALPAALGTVFDARDSLNLIQWRLAVVGALGLTAVGTYVSSVCRTSMAALVGSVPSVLALILYFRLLVDRTDIPALRGRHQATSAPEGLAFVAGAGLIVLLVSLAFRNHRRAGSTMGRLLRQIPAIAAYVAAAAVVMSLLD